MRSAGLLFMAEIGNWRRVKWPLEGGPISLAVGAKRFENLASLLAVIGQSRSRDFLQDQRTRRHFSLCGTIGRGAPVQNIFLENSCHPSLWQTQAQRIRSAVFLIVVISKGRVRPGLPRYFPEISCWRKGGEVFSYAPGVALCNCDGERAQKVAWQRRGIRPRWKVSDCPETGRIRPCSRRWHGTAAFFLRTYVSSTDLRRPVENGRRGESETNNINAKEAQRFADIEMRRSPNDIKFCGEINCLAPRAAAYGYSPKRRWRRPSARISTIQR